jgi:1-acyl-sn-glycerol-3-phosphate acyltransferase
MAKTCGSAIWKSLRGTITRQWCNEALQRWARQMLRLFKIHCSVINPHDIKPQPGKPTIIMCNHTSLLDIPLSLQVFPEHPVRMLAKKELSRIPVMGGGMIAAEFPFIDRKNRKQAIQDLSLVKSLLESGIVMWIAPEGTRSLTGALQPFKQGGFITAIKTGATIIPIGIRGANRILPAHSYQFHLNQHAEVHVGKPIDASDYDLKDKAQLIERVHQAMDDLIGGC